MPQPKAIIVGSGLGGLATALRLTHHGYHVQIIEKHHQAGGRLNQLKKDGFTWDVGPSFFSMSYEFDELFKYVGMKNPIDFHELNPLYTVHFAGKDERYKVYKDLELLAQEFAKIEPDFVAKTEKYLKKASDLFHSTEYNIVKNNFDNPFKFFAQFLKVPVKYVPMLFRNMWDELDSHYDSEQVKIIFSLVAFFLGATPFNTPAVYSLLNYTELKHDGYWNVKGGMYQIVDVMMAELKKRGVQFLFNTEITEVKKSNGAVDGVVDQNGNLWQADTYVVNGDAASFRGQILNREKYAEPKLDKKKWTLAPFTIYLGVKGKIDNLNHHNYFLGDNFKEYADTIFTRNDSPQRPYYYVNSLSKMNDTCAPEGCENLFILCPVQDLRYKPTWEDAEEFANGIIEDLGNRVDFDIKNNILSKTIWTPKDWEEKFNLYKGSGLGLAHDLDQIGYFRPSNKDEELNNLYYVGASTTPGTGLPMVVVGSKLVTERIIKEQNHASLISSNMQAV
ncbi:MAG: phytoene desaturase [Bacteroidia bacterium]